MAARPTGSCGRSWALEPSAPRIMNSHALQVLDFDRALARVAERASSTPGRAALLARSPSVDVASITSELERVRQTMLFIEAAPSWGLPTFTDVAATLGRLAAPGAVVDPRELHAIGLLITASRSLASDLARRTGDDHPALRRLAERLIARPELETRINRTVDADGSVLDSASRELQALRAKLRAAHQRIVRRLDAYVAELPERFRVADASVTVREGRYVIPLRREGRGEVGGIVHDESGTGATIFVEPPVAVELMNELRSLERDEAREIQRILRTISDDLRPDVPDMHGAFDALVDFDTLHARARTALAWHGHVPEVVPAGEASLRLVRARHPLLLGRADIATVVPYDLELDGDERTLVVSGPNTGGKSVFLKAVGLLSLLTQSGIVPPTGPGTRLPVFGDVFADIGDGQSIAESLSTFSAHLENLNAIVTSADRAALVLIDEMGTGTDPVEGAALARAILERLTARGALTIATSHLGALKVLDTAGSGIVNASLEFDAHRLEPTYRLVKGRPGRSYGLAIARRLGFEQDLLERAESLVDEGAASLEALLERLEVQERESRERLQNTVALEAEVDRLRTDLRDREQRLRDRERSAEQRARDQARQLLLNAREQVEAAVREVREATAEKLDEAVRAARRKVEEAASRQKHKRPSKSAAASQGAVTTRGAAIEVGSRVRLTGSNSGKGTVVELRDDRAVVEVGALRLEARVADLEMLAPVTRGAKARDRREAAPSSNWFDAMPDARTEVDLRGLRVDEVDLELVRALDAAVLGELGELRVIHGKGTGAVRERVRELLEGDTRVEAFRHGLAGEGGAGVTVVRLRGAA